MAIIIPSPHIVRAFTRDSYGSSEEVKRVLRAAQRNDFSSFLERCFRHLNAAKPYVMEWYLEAIAHQLERVRRGEIQRLIINLPPRSLKSLTTSVAFPAFLLGHNPYQRIMCISYSSELTASFSNDFRRIMAQEWYRGLFPGTIIDSRKNTETETLTTKGGFRYSNSTGGSLTGRGGNIIIIDDPIKADDALSEVRRNQINTWFANTLASRLDDKESGAIILVMQRVHMNDLTGFLMERSTDWEVLALPAIASEDKWFDLPGGRTYLRRAGEVLSPERESLYRLRKIEQELGSSAFGAQYLQEPAAPGGSMVKREWIKRYDLPPDPAAGLTYLSWDTALKGGPQNAYSVCVVLQRAATDRYYVLDVYRKRVEFPQLLNAVIDMQNRHRNPFTIIEDKASGISLLQVLKGKYLHVEGIKPDGDKEARLAKVTALMERGELYLPVSAPWLADFERELFSFPGGQYDDQVDALSQALSFSEGHKYWGWVNLYGGKR